MVLLHHLLLLFWIPENHYELISTV